MILNRILDRFRCLPPLPLGDKVRYALLRHLYKKLVSRRIIDTDCTLVSPRYPKIEITSKTGGYQDLICLGGFGWSGSGAVLDLLDEYENVTVRIPIGGDSIEKHCPEFDLIRCAGGIFDLERAFGTSNIYIRDAAVRLFLAEVRHIYLTTKGLFGDDFLVQTRDFLNHILLYKTPNRSGFGFCPSLAALGRSAENLVFGDCDVAGASGFLFYLKDLTVVEFRAFAKEYLTDILKSIPSQRFLVLDQVLADYSGDVKRYEEYLGPIRLINVYRDPRDVYAMKLKNPVIDWIPEEVDFFIKWYRTVVTPSLMVRNNHFLLLRFEDIVNSYEETVRKIENFCGLDPSWHVRKFSHFKPDVSRQNVGIYKQFVNDDRMRAVEESLTDFIKG